VHSRHAVATSREYLPGVHAEQREAPATPLNVPAMHDLHALNAGSKTLPATHCRHTPVPPGENQPSSQVTQADAPGIAETVSMAQFSQTVLALPCENFPTVHRRHPLERCAVEYVPGSHSVHSTALASEYPPGTHEVHTVAEKSPEYIPGGHSTHELLASTAL
jgi:hypothetical protein